MNRVMASEVYLRAAKLLKERGHIKYLSSDRRGRMCLGGAIAMAQNGNPDNWIGVTLLSPVADFLIEHGDTFKPGARRIHDAGWIISTWNNDPTRTSDEVIALLELMSKRMMAAAAA